MATTRAEHQSPIKVPSKDARTITIMISFFMCQAPSYWLMAIPTSTNSDLGISTENLCSGSFPTFIRSILGSVTIRGIDGNLKVIEQTKHRRMHYDI